jgi:DNA-binding response OmpR family regulator
MSLPDMHATAFLEELRRLEVKAPVLVLTEPNGVSDTVEAMRAGAHHVVEAPPYSPGLRERVARLLR